MWLSFPWRLSSMVARLVLSLDEIGPTPIFFLASFVSLIHSRRFPAFHKGDMAGVIPHGACAGPGLTAPALGHSPRGCGGFNPPLSQAARGHIVYKCACRL